MVRTISEIIGERYSGHESFMEAEYLKMLKTAKNIRPGSDLDKRWQKKYPVLWPRAKAEANMPDILSVTKPVPLTVAEVPQTVDQGNMMSKQPGVSVAIGKVETDPHRVVEYFEGGEKSTQIGRVKTGVKGTDILIVGAVIALVWFLVVRRKK